MPLTRIRSHFNFKMLLAFVLFGGIASAAFSTELVSLEKFIGFSALAQETSSDDDGKTEKGKQASVKKDDDPKSPLGANDRFIFGLGDLPLLFPQRVDKIHSLAEGGTPQELGSVNDFEPSWSPDGKEIVFVSLRDGPVVSNFFTRQQYREIYTMNADGSDQRRLGGSSFGGEAQPSYSHHANPSLQRIVYVADYSPGGGSSGIYTMTTSGSSQTLLDTDGCFAPPEERNPRKQTEGSALFPGIFTFDTPNFSPNDAFIIFGYPGDDGTDVYRIAPDGTNCTRIYQGENSSYVAATARYSPDGTKIAVYHQDGGTFTHSLRIIDAATGALLQELQPTTFMGSPVWAPDGSDRIAYLGGDQNPDNEIINLDIWTVDLNTEIAQQVYFQGVPEGIRGLDWGTPSTVVPSLSMRINQPNPLTSGASTTATLYLASPAPVGGATISLTALGAIGAITVPSSVFIPEGATEGNFTINSAVSTLYRGADVLATRPSPHFAQSIASVSLHPSRPDLRALSLTAPASTNAGVSFPVSWTVDNVGPVTTGATGGTDVVYFSVDNILDASDGLGIRTQSNPSPLVPGASRTINSTATIPGSLVPASGQYYLILGTNPNEAINEGGLTANNTFAVPIQVNMPDVVAENFIVPEVTEPGVQYNLSWTMRNAGGAPTGSSFTTRLYFSVDNIPGNSDDRLLNTISNAAMAAGESYTQSRNVTVPTVPATPSSNAFFYIEVDVSNSVIEGFPGGTGETNNILFQATDFQYNVPDLQVTSTSAPIEVETDTVFAMEWTSANTGNRNAAPFEDRVYFSADAQVGSDIQIGAFPLSGGLAQGASVNRIQNVTIPTSAITAIGNYWVYVKADGGSDIDEGENESNNTRFHPVTVRRLLRPDLTITNITAPSAAFFGQTIRVQWTVTNNGQGPTNASNWKDRININTTGSSSSSTKIIDVESISALNAGESYIASATVKIPRGLNGSYLIVVTTDINGTLNEESTADNKVTRPITLNIPPLPDLTVSNVQAPEQAFAGGPVNISWQVNNIGDAAAVDDAEEHGHPWQWRDRVYLSRDQVLNTSQDRLIHTRHSRSTPLAPGANFSLNTFVPSPEGGDYVKLPADVSGLYYVFAVTDIGNSVYEFNSENNNGDYDQTQPGSPINILVTPADLVIPAQTTAPASSSGGQYVDISFTVQNQGAFATSGSWTDAIYLSADQTFGGDTRLGSKGISTIGPGGSRLVEMRVKIPDCSVTGNYYLIARTDVNDQIAEFDPGYDAEANNNSPAKPFQITTPPVDLQATNVQFSPITTPGQSATISWTETNTGTGPSPSQWVDRIVLRSLNSLDPVEIGRVTQDGSIPAGQSVARSVNLTLPAFMQGDYVISIQTDYMRHITECGIGEDNNTAESGSFTVGNNLPDLVVDSVTVPATPVTVGQIFPIEWVGKNVGGALQAGAGWRDHAFLSTDATLSNGDRRIGEATTQMDLTPGQTYQKLLNVSTGNVPAGQYFVLIAADHSTDVYEGPGGSTYETNNVIASVPITVGSPNVDLQVVVDSVTSPTYSGTTVNVTYTVTNTGATNTLANRWSDYFILSRDSVIDSTDKTLGYQSHEEVLAGGASYQATKSVNLPAGLTGLYRIFVIADYKNVVSESSDTNNTSQAYDVDLELPPPADLNVTNVVVPGGQSPGEAATFQWTVQNSGSFPAIGPWRDSVYLSRDQFWDAGDILLGQRERTGAPLGVTQTEVEIRGFQIPMIEEGDYYVIIRLDSQNRVRENNEGNNIATSVSQMPVTVQSLMMNTPFSTTLSNGGQRSFKFDPPANETVVVSLLGETGNSNELFTNFLSAASRADYDFQGSGERVADQENFIQNTGEGRYYSFVSHDHVPPELAEKFDKKPEPIVGGRVGGDPPPAPQNITVSANVLPFSIHSISPVSAGNAGTASITIKGAKFAQGAAVKLVAPDGGELAPRVVNIETSRIRALFDLKGKAAGQYDVVVTNPDTQTTSADNAFTVLNGGGHSLRASINGPRTLNLGARIGRYTLSAVNDGINDAQAPTLIFSIPQNIEYEIDAQNYFELPSSLLPAGLNPADLSLHIERDGRKYVMLVLPLVRARSSVDINVTFNIPPFLEFDIKFGLMPPWEDLLKGKSLNASQFDPQTLRDLAANPMATDAEVAACFAEFARALAFTLLGLIPGINCVDDAAQAVLPAIDFLTGYAWGLATGTASETSLASGGISFALSLVVNAAECAGQNFPLLKAAATIWTIGNLINQLLDCLQAIETYSVGRPFSMDPNEKIGPAGYGVERFVGIGQPLLYRISFENLATAEAPAQRVFITDDLPPTLDPRTVRLKEIVFKQNRIVVPENQAFYQSRIQLGEDLNNLYADISAGLDIVNSRVTWTLTAIDPQTGEQPLDPLLGLLPPNNEEHDGEGYVVFTAQAVSANPNRTAINNTSTIYFDANEPIVTNTTTNLLDSVVPASSVLPLPSTSDVPDIAFNWAGTDDTDGSGFKNCEIRASTDGGSYRTIFDGSTLSGTGTFAGQWGKRYAFYSVCSDNAGNIEAAPITSDAETTVLGGDTEGDVAPRPNGNDGQVSVADLTQVRRFAAGLDTDYLYNEFQRADTAPLAVNGDGGLTTADVIQARRFAAGLDATEAAAGPNAAAPVSSIGKTADRSNGTAPREVRPVRVSRTGNKLLVGIDLEAQGNEVGVGFSLNFATSVLSNPTNIRLGSGAGLAALTVNDAQASQGRLGIILDKSPTDPFPAGLRQLVLIEFDVAAGAPPTTNLSFGNVPIFQEVVDGTAVPVQTAFSGAAISLAPPTAAMATVAGRVFGGSNGLSNARVILTDSTGNARTAGTNSFGYFTFTEVAVGQTYLISVSAKRYEFNPQVVSVNEDVLGLEFRSN